MIEVAEGINKALNTAAHTAVSFTIETNTFIFDHADDSSSLTAADAMVELMGIHGISAVSGTHQIIFSVTAGTVILNKLIISFV